MANIVIPRKMQKVVMTVLALLLNKQIIVLLACLIKVKYLRNMIDKVLL